MCNIVFSLKRLITRVNIFKTTAVIMASNDVFQGTDDEVGLLGVLTLEIQKL